MKPVKLFVDSKDLTSKLLKAPLLYPLTGLPEWSLFHDRDLRVNVYDKYVAEGRRYFELSSLNDCDYIIYPFEINLHVNLPELQEKLLTYAEYEKKVNKPVLIFYANDLEVNRWMSNIPFQNPIIFASSLFKSTQPDYLHAQPAFIKDPLSEGFTPYIRQKSSEAAVGFCGFAAPMGVPWGKYRIQEEVRLLLDQLGLLKRMNLDAFHTTRVRALKKINRSGRVKANFIIRSFSAFDSTQGLFSEGKEERAKRLRNQYFTNILESDYVLCSRGHGNFSFRFYETLACSRIPVFINTDSVLPFDTSIDWKRYCIWIDAPDISRIDQRIAQFHHSSPRRVSAVAIGLSEALGRIFVTRRLFS